MATIRDIRKRIISVKNTQKITKAMKMVAAAKLRRAQNRLIQARPYASKMNELLLNLANFIEESPHPVFKLWEPREQVNKIQFLIITSDRGLCGGFNGNLLRRTESFIKEKQAAVENIRISVLGRKGRDFFRSRRREPDEILPSFLEVIPFEGSLKIANDLLQGYTEEKFDEFYLVYNFFRSAISQEIRIEKILPLSLNQSAKPAEAYVPEYLYEPTRKDLLETLIPRALSMTIRRAYMESVAGEYGARMVAMDNATNNCSEMIYRLTLQMNRLRQAVITTELMDIVNGAESLKK